MDYIDNYLRYDYIIYNDDKKKNTVYCFTCNKYSCNIGCMALYQYQNKLLYLEIFQYKRIYQSIALNGELVINIVRQEDTINDSTRIDYFDNNNKISDCMYRSSFYNDYNSNKENQYTDDEQFEYPIPNIKLYNEFFKEYESKDKYIFEVDFKETVGNIDYDQTKLGYIKPVLTTLYYYY